jgi:hypothetical protein
MDVYYRNDSMKSERGFVRRLLNWMYGSNWVLTKSREEKRVELR